MRVKALIFCYIAFVFWHIPVWAQSYTVVTVAGTDSLRDGSPAKTAALRAPYGVASDSAGNFYIADSKANRIRKVSPTGVITTVAGNGTDGFSGDGGPAVRAQLSGPRAIAVDRNGVLYIADYDNHRVRKVDTSGVITTVAGNGNGRASGDGGPATSAGLDPTHIALDTGGNLYIAEYENDRVRKIAAATGIITTVAGTGVTGYGGDAGPASSAMLAGPTATAVDTAGNVYICDSFNMVIRKIGTDGNIDTVVGTGDYGDGGDNGPAKQATLFVPDTIGIDANRQKVYISNLDRIRVVDLQSGIITGFAGTGDIGFSGDGGVALRATFYLPMGIATTPNGDVLIADMGNYRVRRVTNGAVDTAAGTDVHDGGAGTDAFLAAPQGVAVTPNGDVYLSDSEHARIRKVASGDGRISTAAGTGQAGYNSGRIQNPAGLRVDPNGNLVFADYSNNRVQRVASNGVMSTIVGSPKAQAGNTGDGAFAQSALLNAPADVAFDAAGNLYISDSGNFRVRKVDAATGIISTVAGSGRPGSSGLNGPATQAQIIPLGIAVDGPGNIYIADVNSRVLKVAASSGIISMVAGTGAPGFSGDGKPATSAQLLGPSSVALDAAGNLYIADYGNYAIRKVDTRGIITTIAGSGAQTIDRETGPALTCGMSPFQLTVSAAGEVYFADVMNDRVRKLVPAAVRGVSISSGNNQTGEPGVKLTLTVKAVDDAGNGVTGVAVSFTVVSGSATVSPATAITGANGIATTTVTLGAQAGPVVVTATASGFPVMTFNLTVTSPAVVPVVSINRGGVVGAGLSPGKNVLATNGIATVFGQNFAPAGTTKKVEASDLVNGKVPTVLAGVCVEVGTTRAPVFAVYPGQVNFQAPSVAAGENVPVRIVTGCGSQAEVRSASEPVVIQANAPEFFFFRPSTTGKAPVAAIDAVSGAYLGGADLGAGFTAARPKDVVTIFGTSFGPTDPVLAPGEFPPGVAGVTAPVKVTLDGREVTALYAGATPFNPGLYQLNFVVPDDAREGDLEVVLTVGTASTPAGAYLSVRK